MGEVAVGLVEQQDRVARLDHLDHGMQVVEREHRAGGVVRAGEADQLRVGPDQRAQPVEVEPVAVVEREVEEGDVGPDGPGGLDVGGVVGADHHGVVTGVEQGGLDEEQRGRGAAAGVGSGDVSVTDGQGRFQLALAPGEYRLAAHAGEGAPPTELVRVQSGAPTPDVTLRVARGDRVVDGLVRDTEWRPIARARLSVRAAPAIRARQSSRRR